ncbi:DedA family protein [Aurantibacillus circumpalustris]|uniref:DedA family protein n=1 Tax=Aurantibacillus circumpalustris TaxID=3036359 RepID=UPI00295ADFBC|nr:VTT domain-containing protein [Aurantibacillus circumpalustris]
MWEFLKQLTDPNSIIEYGGLWLLLFVIFAETGLLVGFFLPGDNLILLAGILCKAKPDSLHVGYTELVTLMTSAAVLGNATGYWFGSKVGEKLYARKDGVIFKQKQIEITKTYYDKYGGNLTLVMARFLPIVRTFAPIIAGVIKIDFFKFMFFNIVGAIAWILSLTGIGYFLVQMFPQITDYMGYIFIALILLTALPILRIVLKKN